MQKWYKTWWGISLSVIFFPFFIIYYAWLVSNWTRDAKIGTTFAVVIIMMFFIIADSNYEPEQIKQQQSTQSEVLGENAIKDLASAANTTPTAPVVEEPVEKITVEQSNNTNIYKYNTEFLQDKSEYKIIEFSDSNKLKIEKDGWTKEVSILGISFLKKDDCMGEQTRQSIADLLKDKKVYLLQDENLKSENNLVYIIFEDGYFLNYNILEHGLATKDTSVEGLVFSKEFAEAQKSAQNNKLGMWGDVCKCKDQKNKESSRSCSSCNKAKAKYINNDCSEYEKEVDDSSCSELCPKPVVTAPPPAPTPAPSFTCNCSKTCANLSCSEAQFQLNSCGCQARDGDNDGIACDSKCQ